MERKEKIKMSNHLIRERMEEKCKRYGINYKTFCQRFYHEGMSEEDALTKPVNDKKAVEERRKKVIYLYTHFKRRKDIAKEVGLGEGGVGQIIRDYEKGLIDEDGKKTRG